jgi:spore coat protein CotH
MKTRVVASLIAATGIVAAGAVSLWAQFGPGGGPGPQSDLQVVERFDKDDNGWLNSEERAAARQFVQSSGGARGFGGRGRGFGRGGGVAAGSPGPRLTPTDVARVPPTVPLYETGTLRTIFFEFEAPDWEQELALFKDTDVEVAATMTVDGRRYQNVGVSFRGNSSFSMVPEGLKRSFNVTVDLADEDQHLLGFRTLNLLNGVNDASMMRGVLFQHIAQQLIPAARANFVRVVINGESWGVYTNLEQINRDFVEDRFGGENGVRWKVPGSPGARAGLEYLGDDASAYRRLFDIRNRDNAESWSALINLTKVLATTPAERLEAALQPILDVDGALKFLALDAVLANSDGYWVRASDYYLILDGRGRFHVIPGDTNETFSAEGGRGGGARGGGRRGGPVARGGGAPGDVLIGRGPNANMPGGNRGAVPDLLVGLDDQTKPLRSKLLAVPALRDRYLAYCRQIAEVWLDWENLGPLATAHYQLIRPVVESDTRKLITNEQFATGLEDLRLFVEARRAFVLNYPTR